MEPVVITTCSPSETQALGRRLGERLRPGDVVALYGSLGAGKTVLTKGIAEGLGISSLHVTSPTFVLVHEHTGRLRLFHLDAYRLKSGEDLDALGVDEILFGDGVTVIEWADRVSSILPAERLDIEIELSGTEARRVSLSATGARGEQLARELV